MAVTRPQSNLKLQCYQNYKYLNTTAIPGFLKYPEIVVEKHNGFRVVENCQNTRVSCSGKPRLETLLHNTLIFAGAIRKYNLNWVTILKKSSGHLLHLPIVITNATTTQQVFNQACHQRPVCPCCSSCGQLANTV